MKNKRIIAAAMAAGMAVSLAACGSSASTTDTNGSADTATTEAADAATGEGTGFTVQLGPNPETLDPALNAAVDGGNTLITIEEPLLIIDENNEIQPGQAESYEVSDDGLVWTFHLRDGLKWSDGSDLTAADFEYSFKRLACPDTAAPYAETVVGMIDGYQDAIGNPDADGNTTTDPDWDALNVVASEDGKDLTITLSYPCSYFDKLAAFVATSPVQQATVEANGDAWCTEPDTYVCNGPYMITDWIPSERIVLSKNPNYVGGWDSSKIVSDTITLLLLEDSSAAYAAYNSGEAQLVKDVPTDEIPSLTKAEDGGDFYVDTILGTYYISLNDQREPFTDAKVRKALSLAIDRAAVVKSMADGDLIPAEGLVPHGIRTAEGGDFRQVNGAVIDNDPDTYQQRCQQAVTLLREAGFTRPEVIASLGTVTLLHRSTPAQTTLARQLQQVWRDTLGINVTLQSADEEEFDQLLHGGEFTLALTEITALYNDAAAYLDMWRSGNSCNYAQIGMNAYDILMRVAAASTSDEARDAYLKDAEGLLLDSANVVPLYGRQQPYQMAENVIGAVSDGLGAWYFGTTRRLAK